MKRLLALFLIIFSLLSSPTSILAVVNPFSVPNNQYGIHIISATTDEVDEAAKLVNNNGDWGYVTVLIERKDRNQSKWQQFFNEMRRKHLIPIIRLATEPEGNFWKRPEEGEETQWANFLDSLIWPTKNRYIVIYNEPNHATEWGNSVDPKGYARVLEKTIDALKAKSDDFFVMNAGFDASAPEKRPAYADQAKFMIEMNEEVPGIFNKIDGWSSHSYPNPNFSGDPTDSGRGTIRTWYWEQQLLSQMAVNKSLPIFITETGWKHSEGQSINKTYLSPTEVASNYEKAFQTAWNNNRIVAITPFLLNYQEPPFDHFSFKKVKKKASANQVLAAESEYLPFYDTIKNAFKTSGRPTQEFAAEKLKDNFFKTLVTGQVYEIYITVKNTGQSIWNEHESVQLVPSGNSQKLGIAPVGIPEETKVEPGHEYTFRVSLTAPVEGTYSVEFNLFHGRTVFESKPFTFTTEVKQPVILTVNTKLKWSKNPAGEYILSITGFANELVKNVYVDNTGSSKQLEEAKLLPDYTFDFTLDRPFYKPKTIRQTLQSGENKLDFGELQPDISSAILHPGALFGFYLSPASCWFCKAQTSLAFDV